MSLFTLNRMQFLVALLGLGMAAQAQTGQAQEAAKPFLHPLFTDHMVFQRGIKAPVWGWTTPGKKVTVSMDGKSASATAARTSGGRCAPRRRSRFVFRDIDRRFSSLPSAGIASDSKGQYDG